MTDVEAAREAYAVVTAMANGECDLATDLLKAVSDPTDVRRVALFAASYAAGAMASLGERTVPVLTGPEMLAILGPRLENRRA